MTTVKRCKPNHPTMLKLAQLWDLADKLGISLEFVSDACIVWDSADPTSRFYRLEDLEDGSGVCEFPYQFEYKLTFEAE